MHDCGICLPFILLCRTSEICCVPGGHSHRLQPLPLQHGTAGAVSVLHPRALFGVLRAYHHPEVGSCVLQRPLDPEAAGEKAGNQVPQNVNMFLFNAFHSSQGTFSPPPAPKPRWQHKAPCRHMHSPHTIYARFKNTAIVLPSSTVCPH